MSLTIQWLTLGAMIMSGIGMGILFDGYRVVSSEFKFPRWTLSCLDIAYWIASAILVFRMLYVSNYGEVRAYVFIGLAVGAILYYWLFSSFTTTLTKWLIQAIKWLISGIIRMFQLLIVKPLLFLWMVVLYILNLGTKFSIGIGKIMLQLVRPILKLVLWMLSPITKPLLRWLEPYGKSGMERLKQLWLAAAKRLPSWLRRK
ncbi:spore cortex biosynthesis protein YabQ [Paenibacillus camelliae]|uniref:spore cortex biosynthesis protein YabQ n=1 Tax=Paenibacillus camelliae TaxID=512410 RepID=UPI002559E8BC|nr:spore cortex biosynthesis protein YabQ [Paenibacillus camelliae]